MSTMEEKCSKCGDVLINTDDVCDICFVLSIKEKEAQKSGGEK